ncbi:MAG TPA: hypothetical protein VFY10_03920 [Dehalococcoidia bacterium]|nr:hypothetical protein [Dehalococcoidia bacterium]
MTTSGSAVDVAAVGVSVTVAGARVAVAVFGASEESVDAAVEEGDGLTVEVETREMMLAGVGGGLDAWEHAAASAKRDAPKSSKMPCKAIRYVISKIAW